MNLQMNNHNEFILSPITDVLTDVVSASAGIGNGIETFPLCDYVMQSVFLKMTGFQEQKMKCVCWELASRDYEYRYEFTKSPLGECSSYSEKQGIYKGLVEQIKKLQSTFDVAKDIDRDDLLATTVSEVKNIFNNTNLSAWAQNNFTEYGKILNEIEKKHFATDGNSLFTEMKTGTSLKTIYKDHLYRHRNRVAHNTQSYQQNLPTLNTLVKEDYKYENYFVWFAVLILIDKLFIELYRKYLNAFEYY
jgi:hypothetical protein